MENIAALMSEQGNKFFEIHKAAFEDWQEGNPIQMWVDDSGIFCMKYESGKWWHYKETSSGVEWW